MQKANYLICQAILAAIQAAEKKAAEEAAAKKAAEEAAAKKAAEAAAAANSFKFIKQLKFFFKFIKQLKFFFKFIQAVQASSSSTSTSTSTTVSSGSFLFPCAGTLVSNYGPRTAPTAGASTYHRGVDISASAGTPIYSVLSGTSCHSRL